MILCKTDDLVVRSLDYADKYSLVRWLSDPIVLEYYEGRDNVYDDIMVEKKFYSNKRKERYIIEFSNEVIGYLQFYCIEKEQCEEYGLIDSKDIIYGTDMFIGEPKYWGQGIGTVVMKNVVKFLIAERKAKKIILDPQCRNSRAVCCYEKCGFKKVKMLPNHEMHEGELRDCWLMEYSVN